MVGSPESHLDVPGHPGARARIVTMTPLVGAKVKRGAGLVHADAAGEPRIVPRVEVVGVGIDDPRPAMTVAGHVGIGGHLQRGCDLAVARGEALVIHRGPEPRPSPVRAGSTEVENQGATGAAALVASERARIRRRESLELPEAV